MICVTKRERANGCGSFLKKHHHRYLERQCHIGHNDFSVGRRGGTVEPDGQIATRGQALAVKMQTRFSGKINQFEFSVHLFSFI